MHISFFCLSSLLVKPICLLFISKFYSVLLICIKYFYLISTFYFFEEMELDLVEIPLIIFIKSFYMPAFQKSCRTIKLPMT